MTRVWALERLIYAGSSKFDASIWLLDTNWTAVSFQEERCWFVEQLPEASKKGRFLACGGGEAGLSEERLLHSRVGISR